MAILQIEWRKMHTSFFTDPDLVRLERANGLPERSVRLVWAGLWNQADDAGRLQLDPMVLRVRIVPYDSDLDEKTFSRVLDVIVQAGHLKPYQAEGRQYASIRNWTRFQLEQANPKRVAYPPPPTEDPADGEQLDIPGTSRAHEGAIAGTAAAARGHDARIQRSEIRDHDLTHDRRRHASRPLAVEPVDDDDLGPALPESLLSAWSRIWSRAPQRVEVEGVHELVEIYGLPAVEALLAKAEARIGKGAQPPRAPLPYLVSAARNNAAEAAVVEKVERPVGGVPVATAEQQAAWKAEADAVEAEMAKLPACPACAGSQRWPLFDDMCNAWGQTAGGWKRSWVCDAGRQRHVDDDELTMVSELRPTREWRFPGITTEWEEERRDDANL